MRKGILGLLAYCLAGLPAAQAQSFPTGDYQEPLPIQNPGMRYGPAPFPAPVTYPNSKFPGYQAPPSAPSFVPMPPPATPYPFGAQTSYPGPRPGMNPITPVQSPPSEEFMPPPPLPKDYQSTDGADSEPGSSHDGSPTEPYLVGPESAWRTRKGYTVYGSLEYLYWHTKAQPVPAGLSLSLSDPNAVPETSSQGMSGARILLGTWLTDRQDWAFEGGYFFLAQRTATATQSFPANPNILNLPIFAGIDSESASFSTFTNLWGTEGNLRYEICKSDQGHFGWYLDLLGGFRYVDLSENMTLSNSTTFSTAPVFLSNATVTTSDSFGTHNHLFAGQFGAETGVNLGRFNVNFVTKLALGDNRETVVINGATQVMGNQNQVLGNFTTPGGFFTQPSNIGSYIHNQFSVVPEIGVNLGFKVSEHCRLAVGYSFLGFVNVVRPGGQIDVTAGGATRPSLGFLGGPGTPAPAFNGFNETSFWAQGVNFMVEFSY